MANKEFSVAIKNIRSNNGLTMQDLAKQLNVTKSAVNMWENKGVVPRDEVLLKISKLFNVSIDRLLGNNVETIDESNDDKRISYIQRNLRQLNHKQLEQAENMLKAVFDDIFEDEESEDDDDL